MFTNRNQSSKSQQKEESIWKLCLLEEKLKYKNFKTPSLPLFTCSIEYLKPMLSTLLEDMLLQNVGLNSATLPPLKSL